LLGPPPSARSPAVIRYSSGDGARDDSEAFGTPVTSQQFGQPSASRVFWLHDGAIAKSSPKATTTGHPRHYLCEASLAKLYAARDNQRASGGGPPAIT
jgi:hypothetical protein